MTMPSAAPPAVFRIADNLGPMLVLREAAAAFFSRLEASPSRTIIVDFSDARFMSRSFAHEYLTRRSASKKHILERNAPDEVVRMTAVVEQQIRAARAGSSRPRRRLAMTVGPVSNL